MKQFSNLVGFKEFGDEVPGVNAFIKKYSKELNFWIITGTPTSEIEIIANSRDLTNYFSGIIAYENKDSAEKMRLKISYCYKVKIYYVSTCLNYTFSNLHFTF